MNSFLMNIHFVEGYIGGMQIVAKRWPVETEIVLDSKTFLILFEYVNKNYIRVNIRSACTTREASEIETFIESWSI